MNRLIISHIESWLFRQKVIVLYGARQVGKTTLSKMMLKKPTKEASNLWLCSIRIPPSILGKT